MTSTIFRRAAWTVGVSFVLAVGAGLRYPGGTLLDASIDRYSMSLDFLSDLGMTAAYDGAPNRLGASPLAASLLLLVVGLGHCLAGFMALASRHAPQFRRRAARTWLRAAVLLAGYVALMEWGPGLDSVGGLRTQVLAQKAAVVALPSALLFLAREADRVRTTCSRINE
jgi:hypothetical protein